MRLVVVERLTVDAGRANVVFVGVREGYERVDLVVWVEVSLLLLVLQRLLGWVLSLRLVLVLMQVLCLLV